MQIDWAVVFATLSGPILAVWASEWRQQRRALHERKEWVFRTLMSTRAARLRIEHVAAINQIDFAFPRQSCASVQDAWGLYRQNNRGQTTVSVPSPQCLSGRRKNSKGQRGQHRISPMTENSRLTN